MKPIGPWRAFFEMIAAGFRFICSCCREDDAVTEREEKVAEEEGEFFFLGATMAEAADLEGASSIFESSCASSKDCSKVSWEMEVRRKLCVVSF